MWPPCTVCEMAWKRKCKKRLLDAGVSVDSDNSEISVQQETADEEITPIEMVILEDDITRPPQEPPQPPSALDDERCNNMTLYLKQGNSNAGTWPPWGLGDIKESMYSDVKCVRWHGWFACNSSSET